MAAINEPTGFVSCFLFQQGLEPNVKKARKLTNERAAFCGSRATFAPPAKFCKIAFFWGQFHKEATTASKLSFVISFQVLEDNEGIFLITGKGYECTKYFKSLIAKTVLKRQKFCPARYMSSKSSRTAVNTK